MSNGKTYLPLWGSFNLIFRLPCASAKTKFTFIASSVYWTASYNGLTFRLVSFGAIFIFLAYTKYLDICDLYFTIMSCIFFPFLCLILLTWLSLSTSSMTFGNFRSSVIIFITFFENVPHDDRPASILAEPIHFISKFDCHIFRNCLARFQLFHSSLKIHFSFLSWSPFVLVLLSSFVSSVVLMKNYCDFSFLSWTITINSII